MNILVLKEKYGNRYFDASTLDKLHSVASQIVKVRADEGWYDDDGNIDIDLCVRDGKTAYAFLLSRRDFEYEGIELERLEEGYK